MRKIFIILIFLPFCSFSQGLEGGFVDNNKDDLITRLAINKSSPELDKPVMDIIQFEKTIIVYTDGSLYAYDAIEEKSTLLKEYNLHSAEFIQLEGSMLYMNLYDEDGFFKQALQYNVATNKEIQVFSYELVQITNASTFRFATIRIADQLRLGYIEKEGSAIVPYSNLFFKENYQINIDNKGYLWAIMSPSNKPAQNGLVFINTDKIGEINLVGNSTDATYAFVNGQAYYSIDKQLLKAGSDTGYNQLALENDAIDGFYQATDFYVLGENKFGFYYENSDGDKKVLLVDTQGSSDTKSYKFQNLLKEEYLTFEKSIQSIFQSDQNHIAISNFSGSTYQTLVVNDKGEVLNAVPSKEINIITQYPVVQSKVFNEEILSIQFQKVTGDKIEGSICYLDLTDLTNFAFDEIPIYETKKYDFEPTLVSARGIDYVVFNTETNGFELNVLTNKTQNGFQIAEEITNDEFARKAMEDLGVSNVKESFSTYPERLMVINNTLYYKAHLASGDYNGNSYL